MARFARPVLILGLVVVFCAPPAFATIVGHVQGDVRDPQGRPIAGATVLLQAQSSEWTRSSPTDAQGHFDLRQVPIGQYVLTIVQTGFAELTQGVQVDSDAALDLHLTLALASVKQSVTVSAAPPLIDRQSSTTQTLISREAIRDAPGAERSNSLAMITDYLPGSYMVHDQLHVRGGHQVAWQVDGVPVPNTNIASNVGPQFDPKDIEYLEAQRGGYSAEYGDRTYGVFNIVPRSGFEGTNVVDASVTYGSFNQTNDYVSYGSHTSRLGWFLSANGNRSDYGLETPTADVIHDGVNGAGGFASVIFNASPSNQLRVVGSARGDRYQVPNDPVQQADGINDAEHEDDAFVNLSWMHTAGNLTLTVSPYYHVNRAHYIGGAHDTPFIPEDDRGSQYAGGQVSGAVLHGRSDASFGLQAFAQRDNTLFALTATDGSDLALSQRVQEWATVTALFGEERYRATSWLTLNGGLRYTHYHGEIAEDAVSPRVGAAVQIPALGWVARGFYGRDYQAPPLNTISGPLLAFALDQGFGFLPLEGERDAQWEAGLAIPVHGWTIDVDRFETHAKNFFDHDALGNSNIFFPLTIDEARIRGWETTVRAPRLLAGRLDVHVAYSNQTVEGRGAVTGGLTDFEPPEDEGYFFLDHDQRNTLSAGFAATLPKNLSLSGDLLYGSGFLDGNGPAHLPQHATFDVALGKRLTRALSLSVSALNVGNVRYLLDASNTFGGTHFNEPRQFIVALRYDRRP